ncbi:MAG: DUF4288 domain-containing protein [Chitinophagaceae bacterium]|nr:DUF4288 domain-containing protein [Chitinophagaceae bacterium]MCB9046163.1 DUF4288 domain-containing protein [Chitinophagales bacterium]
MKTFASQIIYSIKCDGVFTGQYDEQWRLVFAEDEERAIEEAKTVGMNESSIMVDRHGRTISWELIAIKDIRELQLGHGSLLSSKVIDVTAIASPVWKLEAV